MKDICVIAHKGFSGPYPENTELAFLKAAENGFGGAETDVHITADGRFIINHDSEVRFADGSVMIAEQTDYDTLLSKPLLNDKTDDTVYVCPLRRYLEIMRDNNMVCFVEIKSSLNYEQIKSIYDLMAEVYDLKKCIVQSFDFNNLVLSRQYIPGIPIMLTHGMGEKHLGYERCFDGGFSIDIDYNMLDDRILEDFHSRGLEVGVWTVNDREAFDRLLKTNVDYIETDWFPPSEYQSK